MSTTPRYADRNEQPSTRSKRNPLCRNNKKAWARVRRRKESWPVENPKRFLPVGRIPDESAALRNTVEPSLLGRFLTSSDEINHPYLLSERGESERKMQRESMLCVDHIISCVLLGMQWKGSRRKLQQLVLLHLLLLLPGKGVLRTPAVSKPMPTGFT
ncbi:hypothetical protein BHE74_00021957 [Ensete ventricosum]|nr:hypothetical protein BHE74_00021957 [Ensete ventricosum]